MEVTWLGEKARIVREEIGEDEYKVFVQTEKAKIAVAVAGVKENGETIVICGGSTSKAKTFAEAILPAVARKQEEAAQRLADRALVNRQAAERELAKQKALAQQAAFQ